MTRKLFEENSNSALLEFTAMFDALTPEYRSSVVMRALRARDHVSTEAGRALDSAIRGSIRIIGYSNPALAISSALLEPVSGSVVKSEKLAAATLRVWAESMDELEKMVSSHLATEGLPTDYPDLDNGRFRGFWDEDSWQKEMDWIVDLSELWEEEDVALMLCYVSGQTIVLDEEEEDSEVSAETFLETTFIKDKPVLVEPEEEQVPAVAGEPEVEETPRPSPVSTPAASPPPTRAPAEIRGPAILNQCIDYLRALSPEDWHWNEAVPAFVDAVSDIRDLKSAQRERRASLVAAHSEITQEFSADLEFLEQDTSFWSAQELTELADLDRTLDMAASLKNLLSEYREVRRPGATLSEEVGRRGRRSVLEPRIIDTMGLMRQAMTGARRARDSASASAGGESDADNSEPSGLRLNSGEVTRYSETTGASELTYEPLDDDTAPRRDDC